MGKPQLSSDQALCHTNAQLLDQSEVGRTEGRGERGGGRSWGGRGWRAGGAHP